MLKGGPKIVAFQDFAIRFGTKQREGYPIRVSAGAASGAGFFRIPFSSGELETLLAELGSAIHRSVATVGVGEPGRHLVPVAHDTAPAQQLRTSGAKLFRALFSDQVGNLYNFCLGGAERTPDRGLRIMLRFDSKHPDLPRLSNLPWELLYDEDRRAFLNLSRFTPIIRCLEVPHPGAPLIFQPPLRILAAISRPVSHGALNLAEERRLIEGAWEKHRAVEVTFLEPATVMALREALLEKSYQVVHFMGHGAFAGHQEEGTLLFEKSDGTAHAVSGSSLASLLRDVRSLRLLVLNACDTARVSNQQGHDPLTGVATALVAGGFFAVVAMQFPISDQAAITFTRFFYSRLAAGDPVDAAAAEGRLAIHTENQDSLEWSTPVLFMRSPEGIPFEDLMPELVKAEPGASPSGRDDHTPNSGTMGSSASTKRAPGKGRVFLVYSRTDADAVREIRTRLEAADYRAWMDDTDIVGGEDWKDTIIRSMCTSRAIVICLSPAWRDKEAFCWKEALLALEAEHGRPKGHTVVIPIRLRACELPEFLQDRQCVDLWTLDGFERLSEAIDTASVRSPDDTVVSPDLAARCRAALEYYLELGKTRFLKRSEVLATAVIAFLILEIGILQEWAPASQHPEGFPGWTHPRSVLAACCSLLAALVAGFCNVAFMRWARNHAEYLASRRARLYCFAALFLAVSMAICFLLLLPTTHEIKAAGDTLPRLGIFQIFKALLFIGLEILIILWPSWFYLVWVSRGRTYTQPALLLPESKHIVFFALACIAILGTLQYLSLKNPHDVGYGDMVRAFHIELQAVMMIGLAAIGWWLRGVAEELERRAVMLRRHPDGTPVRVFVSYAHEDVEQVLGVYDWLRANGCDPWLDQRNLLPGQRWEEEIRKQITCADIFIACLSSRSVDKRGFFHKELADALEACEQVPEDQIYIIPIRLDPCPVQGRLSRFQFCDLFEPGAMEFLLRAIRNVARQKARRGNRVR